MIKRKIFIVLMGAIAIFTCAGGGKKDAPKNTPAEPVYGEVQSDTSYAIGMWVGASIRQQGMDFDFNYTELLNGIRDSVEERETRLTVEQAIALMQSAHAENLARLIEENRQAGEAFLAENIKREGVRITANGLQYEALVEGTGPRPGPDSTVTVHYELSLVDGTVLESSFEGGQPVDIPLDQLIPGWVEGLQLMPVGSTYNLYLPPALAYGENGGAGIPPNATLVFKIKLLSIVQESADPPSGRGRAENLW